MRKIAFCLSLTFFLAGCSPFDLVKSVIPSKQDPLLSVDTHVGDNSASVGQTQSIHTNTGTAIGNDQYSAQSITVNNDLPLIKKIINGIFIFLCGFVIGWPIEKTPQSFIKNIFTRKKSSSGASPS